jgi:hypothetical protein
MTPHPSDPMLSDLLAYWERLRGGRAMPSRRDIDPLALGARLLPHVIIVDVVDGGVRFRFRLCGSAVADAAGLDLTGKYIDTLNPNKAYGAYIEGLYRRVLGVRRPVYSETMYWNRGDGPRRRATRLLCPLSDDDAAVQHVIGAQTFTLDPGFNLPTMTYAGDFQPTVETVL